MKKILLLSDTHSYIDNHICAHAKKVDEVWHAGDIGDLKVTDTLQGITTLRAVYGNIDGNEARSEFPLHNRFDCEGLNVWITHIGGYPGKYARGMRKLLLENPPGLFICGHSHILKVMPDTKLGFFHMNPGAAGKHGFHTVRTMLRFIVAQGKIENLEVIEMPR